MGQVSCIRVGRVASTLLIDSRIAGAYPSISKLL